MRKKDILFISLRLIFVFLINLLFFTVQSFNYISNYGHYTLEYSYIKENSVNFLNLSKYKDIETQNEQFLVDEPFDINIWFNDNSECHIDSITYYNKDLSNIFNIYEKEKRDDKINVYVFSKYSSMLGKSFGVNDKDYYVSGIINRYNKVEDEIGMYDTFFVNGEVEKYLYKSCVLSNDEIDKCIKSDLLENRKIYNLITNQKERSIMSNLLLYLNSFGYYTAELVCGFVNDSQFVFDLTYILTNILMYIALLLFAFFISKRSWIRYYTNKEKRNTYLDILKLSFVIMLSVYLISSIIIKNMMPRVHYSYILCNTLIYVVPYIIFMALVMSFTYYKLNNKFLKLQTKNA